MPLTSALTETERKASYTKMILARAAAAGAARPDSAGSSSSATRTAGPLPPAPAAFAAHLQARVAAV